MESISLYELLIEVVDLFHAKLPSNILKEILKQLSTSNNLELRNQNLMAEDVKHIMHLIEQTQEIKLLSTLSFSYNPLLKKQGVIELSSRLPKTLKSIGLVGCGISDRGGITLLDTLHQLPHLTMLCIEQNELTNPLTAKFKAFGN